MDRIGSLLMVLLATTSYSATSELTKVCDDSGVCLGLKPTDAHHKYGDDMDEFIKTNKIWQPYVIETKESSNNKSIIVQRNNFRQIIKWTECSDNKPKKPCFGAVFSSINEVETQCGEKYGAVSLFVYDPVNNEIGYKMFEVPVACVCRFKYSYE